MADLLYLAADSLPLWRDGAVVLLAGIVVGLLYLAS